MPEPQLTFRLTFLSSKSLSLFRCRSVSTIGAIPSITMMLTTSYQPVYSSSIHVILYDLTLSNLIYSF